MKVRIAYTIEVDKDYRRAINIYYGLPGIASLQEVRRWAEMYGNSMDLDLSTLMEGEDE